MGTGSAQPPSNAVHTTIIKPLPIIPSPAFSNCIDRFIGVGLLAVNLMVARFDLFIAFKAPVVPSVVPTTVGLSPPQMGTSMNGYNANRQKISDSGMLGLFSGVILTV
ncbi:MAG: hypothetical protein HOK06_05270 [Rhodospirillaceae bacterium]|nr:hypothetical protein [Rhodospirillaceae bacterium]MBT4220106.1 hypothetical protein [Rhodospirillaceae bacterium]MBT5014424.1 hypothetical protein [Rhodospirillaceae bacterium]MBT5309144.1 hypothetical protein [Rhodospirillaceae bacterium]MBT6406994.1 hypothetical protein [Rhodospirillaceae bacterium]